MAETAAGPTADGGQLSARINGVFEWLCPLCLGMTRTWVDPKVPFVQCCSPACRRTHAVGVVAYTSCPQAAAPFNALRYHAERLVQPLPGRAVSTKSQSVSYRHNTRVDPTAAEGLSAYEPVIARIVGTVEWRCAACSGWNLDYPHWVTGRVVCEGCTTQLWLAAGLLPPRPNHRQLPVDWVGVIPPGRQLRYNLRAARTLRGRKATKRGVGAVVPPTGLRDPKTLTYLQETLCSD